MKTLDELLDAAAKKGGRTVAVAAAHDTEVLSAVKGAGELGLARAILVGDREKIARAAETVGLELDAGMIIHRPDDREAAREAVALVSSGRAEMVMKGLISTADFLHAVLDKEIGLQTGRLLSHVAAFEMPGFDRLIFVTDAAMNVAPDLLRKVDIVNNCASLARALGIREPRVAALAAAETVNPSMPATIDGALLSKMSERGQIKSAIIDGPLALDNAISVEAAEHKGIRGPVAGRADILLVPDIEAGNILYKSMTYFAGGKNAGVVAGASAPIILLSRADTHLAKMQSIALGLMMSSQ